jgi:hypothetical protein
MIIRSGQPIRQRRLLQVTDAIHFQRNPVTAPAIYWAATAWVASASSRRGGAKRAAKCTAAKTSSSRIQARRGERAKEFSGGASRERTK